MTFQRRALQIKPKQYQATVKPWLNIASLCSPQATAQPWLNIAEEKYQAGRRASTRSGSIRLFYFDYKFVHSSLRTFRYSLRCR